MDTLIQRVSDIMLGRFGCRLEVVERLTTPFVEAVNPDLLQTVRRNAHAEIVMMQNDVIVPVMDRGELVGFAVVIGGGNLEWSLIEKARQMLELLLKPYLIEKHREREISSFEHVIASQESRNLVSLVNHPKFEERRLTESEGFNFMKLETRLESHYLIEAPDRDLIRRNAVDIHEDLNRQIMVSLSDIAPDLLISSKDLFALGEMTLLVPDLEDVPLATQVVIEQYLRLGREIRGSTLLILGTTGNLNDLVSGKRILKDFLEIPSLLRMRPSHSKKLSQEEIAALIESREDLQRLKHLTLIPSDLTR